MKNITLQNRKTNSGTAPYNPKAAETLELSPAGTAVLTELEAQRFERANAKGLQPVVFVHGLWLLPSSWDRWATVFEEAGYVAVSPSWPDDPRTVDEANATPEVFANKTVWQFPDHFTALIRNFTSNHATFL